MAKKISNLIWASIIGFFSLLIIGTLLVSLDNITGNSNRIGDDAISLSDVGIDEYQDTEIQLQTITYNTTGVQNIENFQFIDPRVVTEGSIISRNQPSSMVEALTSIWGVFGLHPLILTMIASLIIITGAILFWRLITNEGKI